MVNQSSPVFGSGEVKKKIWNYVDVTSDFNCFAALLVSVTVRNKRTAQAERLSAITVALQYESDEEGILSGTSSPQHRNTCRNYSLWLACHDVLSLFSFNLQVLFTMMKGSQRQRVWRPTWTWVIPSSSCTRLFEVLGTARANWSPSLSCSCPPGRTTPTTTSRSVNPSACIRSSMN